MVSRSAVAKINKFAAGAIDVYGRRPKQAYNRLKQAKTALKCEQSHDHLAGGGGSPADLRNALAGHALASDAAGGAGGGGGAEAAPGGGQPGSTSGGSRESPGRPARGAALKQGQAQGQAQAQGRGQGQGQGQQEGGGPGAGLGPGSSFGSYQAQHGPSPLGGQQGQQGQQGQHGQGQQAMRMPVGAEGHSSHAHDSVLGRAWQQGQGQGQGGRPARASTGLMGSLDGLPDSFADCEQPIFILSSSM
jgi:hypothetical protein